MYSISNLQPNAPVIKEDLTLGILSCTINIEGAIKTYYFQHVLNGLVINDQLAFQLQSAFEGANIQEGHNGISTSLDSFIPAEIMDSSLLGIRQVGVDYLDQTYSTITVEYIAMRDVKIPQALLYHMLDEVLQEYKASYRVLKFHISSEVISVAKQQGFYHHLTKFTQLRGLKQEIVDSVEIGYIHEDRNALDIMEIKKKARQIDVGVSNETKLARLRLQGGIQEKISINNLEPKVRKPFSFLPRMR
jgi:hypothetical protein